MPVPYRPITEALMGAARSGVTPDSPRLTDYRSALGTLVPEWRQPQDRTGHISAMILGEARAAPADPAGLARRGLLVLEDLHWADPETLAFVEYLTDNIGGTTVLCLITQRDVDGSPAAGPAPFRDRQARGHVVDVPRLTPGRHRADGGGVPVRRPAPGAGDHAAGRLRRPAVRGRGDPGRLGVFRRAVRDDSGWQVNPAVSTGVPDSIAGSVRNRLTRSARQAPASWCRAAILGLEFDWALLPKVSPASETDVLAALKRARELRPHRAGRH